MLLRGAVRGLDAGQPIAGVRTLEQVVAGSVAAAPLRPAAARHVRDRRATRLNPAAVLRGE